MLQHLPRGGAWVLLAVLGLCLPVRTEPVPDQSMRPDAELQRSLENTIQDLQLKRAAGEHRLALSLVDVTDEQHPRYAGVNDHDMMYAASLPKIAVLVAGFERIREGRLEYTPDVKEMFTRMVRFSSNVDASRAIQKVGFGYIAQVLTGPKYRFYDLQQNGGLWIGKAYGGPNDYWQRDPLHHLSHGATSIQVARFFVMMEQGRLVSPHYSAEIKEILSHPGIHHKFVKGLDSRPGHLIYRKSGTWLDWHADAALVEHNNRKYVAVALMQDPHGGEVLPKLILKFDDLLCDESERAGPTARTPDSLTAAVR